jgi:hypothetical protein
MAREPMARLLAPLSTFRRPVTALSPRLTLVIFSSLIIKLSSAVG